MNTKIIESILGIPSSTELIQPHATFQSKHWKL